MSNSPTLSLPLLTPGVAGHALYNQSLALLEVLLAGCVAYRTATPPGSPAEGEAHIIANSPTAGTVWVGHGKQIAVWFAGGWRYATPAKGTKVCVDNPLAWAIYNGSEWVLVDRHSGKNTNAQTFTSSTRTGIVWDSAIHPGSTQLFTHPYSSNDDQLQVAETGYYRISVAGEFSNGGTASQGELGIAVGSIGSSIGGAERLFDLAANSHAAVEVRTEALLTAGDVLYPWARKVSGSTITLAATRLLVCVERLIS